MKPVLLFDLGDTLVQYYRREEFPPLLRAGIHAAKEALKRSGHDLPADSEVERGVAAENYEPQEQSRPSTPQEAWSYLCGRTLRFGGRVAADLSCLPRANLFYCQDL